MPTYHTIALIPNYLMPNNILHPKSLVTVQHGTMHLAQLTPTLETTTRRLCTDTSQWMTTTTPTQQTPNHHLPTPTQLLPNE